MSNTSPLELVIFDRVRLGGNPELVTTGVQGDSSDFVAQF